MFPGFRVYDIAESGAECSGSSLQEYGVQGFRVEDSGFRRLKFAGLRVLWSWIGVLEFEVFGSRERVGFSDWR